MHKMKKPLLIFPMLFFFLNTSHAQTALYEWSDHLPYSSGKEIAISENKVFCLTNGGLFSYKQNSNAIERLSKITGLSDINFSTIHYCEKLSTLLIGYKDGNIDVIIDNNIYNIQDVERKQIIGSKSINKATFYNNLSYLSCGFGIIVLDTKKREIRETYFIGEGGTHVVVNDIAFDNEYIYAATKNGIYVADINDPNLIDFNEWNKIQYIPDYSTNVTEIEFFNNRIYALQQPEAETLNNKIIVLENNNYRELSQISDDVYSIRNSDDQLLISSSRQVAFLNTNGTIIKTIDNNTYDDPYPRDALVDDAGTMWVADYYQGLVKIEGSNVFTYLPDGPSRIEVWDIEIEDNTVWVTGGGPNNMWGEIGAYQYVDQKWNNVNFRVMPELQWTVYNFSIVEFDPWDPSHVFFGSHASGLVEFNNGQLTKVYNESNSVLDNIGDYTSHYIRVTGLDFDKNNNLWISTTMADNPVYVKPYGKEIISIGFDYPGLNSSERIGDIIVTQNDNKWLIMKRSGLFVFDHKAGGGDFNEQFVSVKNSDGELISSIINAVAEDLEGNIWVGTDNGPAVFYNPERVFEETIYANQVLIPRNDGTGLADPLLETENITCITIDGANRKWFGTTNSGAFLISEDGTKELRNFNVDNSPIFSNNIIDIDINQETGEVYLGTDLGLISFREAATKASNEFGDVYVYPNPVRETYEGDIVITGLIEETIVKITDITGNLVFETTSLGGQAVWNGKNFDDRRVKTGVYLVFLSNKDGSKTHITKLLFIN